MTGLLFWNVGRRNHARVVRDVCIENSIDILTFAEFDTNPAEFLLQLNDGLQHKYHWLDSQTRRINMFSRFPFGSVSLVSDDDPTSIRQVSPPIGPDILLAAVHLPSKLYYSETEQALNATRLRNSIEAAERRAGHSRTVVIGDLNMNPFEAGVVSSETLHSTFDRNVAKSISRTVNGETRKYFYNPMWRFYGGQSGVPQGTYYRKDSSPICYFWNLFDQVLVRPELWTA